jgi:uncharacterized protein YkwD
VGWLNTKSTLDNLKRQGFWAVAILCVALVGQAGQVSVLAEGPESVPSPGCALGVRAPGEKLGQVTFLDTAPSAPISVLQTDEFVEEVVRLINLERDNTGLPPYEVNPILAAIAEGHSVYMRDQDCFSHQCPGEVSTAQRACDAGYQPYGWGGCYTGETIAGGFATPASVVEAWMDSPGHRSILLHDQLREIGVGYASGGTYGVYCTADFGSQPDVLPVFLNDGEQETDDRQVTLSLTNETVSGWGGIDCAEEVMIGNDPDFSGAHWEPFACEKIWALSSCGGQKTVYVKYRDASGYEVISSDEILYNEPLAYELELGADSLTFYYRAGSGFLGTPTAPVAVDNAAGCAMMNWDAACSGGGMWPEVTPESGVTPDQLSISVDGFQAVVPGTYTALVSVASPQDPENLQELTVIVLASEEAAYRILVPLVVGLGE